MGIKVTLVRDDLRQLGRLGEKELKRELVFQKHVASSDLLDSINHKITHYPNGVRVGFYMNEYGLFVNSGRAAGGRRVPIDVLIRWAKIKGFSSDDKELRSIAFAIQEKIFKEGIPTSKSKRIASRRTRFIDIVEENIKSEAREIISEGFQDNVRAQLSAYFRKAQQEINAMK